MQKINLSPKDVKKGVKLPTVISSNLAYICGILTGDGSIYSREEKNDYIIKCVGNPRDEQELYTKIIAPLFKELFGFIPNICYQDSKTTYGFVLYSKAIFTYLTEVIGMSRGKKYDTLCIPAIFKKEEYLLISFLRGLFDTDGCISFKKKYKPVPYYPVITLSSKSSRLIREVADILKEKQFKVVEIYDYKLFDKRIKKGYTKISRLELNGKYNLLRWNELIGFSSPKHLAKIKEYWKE